VAVIFGERTPLACTFWRLAKIFQRSDHLNIGENELPVQQLLVLIVWADPDPQESIRHIDGDCAIAGRSYSHRVSVAHFLEAQRRRPRIFSPQTVCAPRRPPNWLWQLVIELPKLIRPG